MLGEAWPDIAPEEHSRVSELFRYDLAWVGQRRGWLNEASCAFTNVLAFRPPGNRLDDLCVSKAEVGKDYSLPSLVRGKYLREEFLPELSRLAEELETCQPNLVVAMGNTACWALLQATNISQIRGTITSSVDSGLKVLPTYHPAAILRQWQWRVITVADLMKARREMASAEIRRPSRAILINPTLAEWRQRVESLLASPPPLLACDTETSLGLIDTIGFAASADSAFVCQVGPHRNAVGKGYSTIWPLRDGQRRSSYWSMEEEIEFWRLNQQLLESSIPLVFQNGLYDLQYLLKMGLRPNCLAGEDTMLLHHALFPELQKGLGFLGSIYTNESSWKIMRKQKSDSEKRDE